MPVPVRGVALRPIVSANKRSYTKETLQKAHDRLAARLADPAGKPVTMKTYHPKPNGADADVMAIAGRLTSCGLDADGAITYEGVLADTEAGQTVAKLTTPDAEGKQYLGNVSIRGYAIGAIGRDADGNETFDDLEIAGLDFTDDPGIEGAVVTAAAEAAINAETTETGSRHFISESVDSAFVDSTDPAEDATMPTATEATTAPTPVTPGGSDYADPGWQKDKKKRYPLNSKARAMSAWAYISKPANAAKYSADQVGKIKAKIKAALKKFGVTVKESAAFPELFEDALAAMVEESFAAKGSIEEARASMDLYNGQASIGVSGWTDEPADLPALAAQIAKGALAALTAVDPDNDGDIDGIQGAPCAACDCDVPVGAAFCPACGAAVIVPEAAPATATTEAQASDPKEAAMGDQTTDAAATATAETTTETAAPAATTTTEAAPAAAPGADVIAEAIKAGITAGLAAIKANETATAATAETTTETTETATAEAPKFLTEADLTRLNEEADTRVRASLAEEARAAGITPARRGLVRLAESAEGKAYADMSRDEKDAYASDAAVAALFPDLVPQD